MVEKEAELPNQDSLEERSGWSVMTYIRRCREREAWPQVEADLLVLLTDQQGLYNADPRSNPNASLVAHGLAGDRSLDIMAAGGGGRFGQGGMQTKLRAARLAADSLGASRPGPGFRSPGW